MNNSTYPSTFQCRNKSNVHMYSSFVEKDSTAASWWLPQLIVHKPPFTVVGDSIKHQVVTVNACNSGIPVRLSCLSGDALEKTKQTKTRGRARTCVHVCLCVSDPPEAKASLMNSKWLWEVNKQTNTSSSYYITPNWWLGHWDAWVRPCTQTHQPTYPWKMHDDMWVYSPELKK